jgi:putative endonuclease
MFFVYILHSEKLNKYYVGQTADVNLRLSRHNEGWSKFTSTGVPWKLVTKYELKTRSEAMALEKKIKGRGIKRYLEDFGM